MDEAELKSSLINDNINFFCSIGGFVRVQSNVSAAILCGVRLHQNFPRPISSFSPLPDIQLSSYTAPNENETVAGLG